MEGLLRLKEAAEQVRRAGTEDKKNKAGGRGHILPGPRLLSLQPPAAERKYLGCSYVEWKMASARAWSTGPPPLHPTERELNDGPG